jgi:hypothetical protein
MHAVASGAKSTLAVARNNEKTGLKLNLERIAELQQDTEKVSILLSNIFQDEKVIDPQLPTEAEVETEHETKPMGILELDESHAALARILLSRSQWSRQELLDVAVDLDLMLDGALERVNEASFDIHDIPFTEGDDLIVVNAELLKRIEA